MSPEKDDRRVKTKVKPVDFTSRERERRKEKWVIFYKEV